MVDQRSAATTVAIGNMAFFELIWKKKELIPLVAFVTAAGFGAIYSLCHAAKKQDVIFNKTNNPEPWEHVNPTLPQKLVTINQQWKAIEELEKVRKMTK